MQEPIQALCEAVGTLFFLSDVLRGLSTDPFWACTILVGHGGFMLLGSHTLNAP